MTDTLIDKARELAEDGYQLDDMDRMMLELIAARLEAAENVCDHVGSADEVESPLWDAYNAWRAIRDAKEQP